MLSRPPRYTWSPKRLCTPPKCLMEEFIYFVNGICILNKLYTKFHSLIVFFSMFFINSYNIMRSCFCDFPHSFHSFSINMLYHQPSSIHNVKMRICRSEKHCVVCGFTKRDLTHSNEVTLGTMLLVSPVQRSVNYISKQCSSSAVPGM